MTNRKEIELERFINEIDHTWKLSLTEVELLEDVLNIIKRREDISNLPEFIEYFVIKDYEEILDFIPSSYKEDRAEWNGYKDEDDCPAQKTLEDFDDDEIEQEYFDRNNVGQRVDIVTSSQFEEMSDLFLSLSFSERENLLSQLRK